MTFIHYKSWLIVQMLWSSCMWETLKKTLRLVLPHTSRKKKHLQLSETETELLGTVLEKKNEQKCEKENLCTLMLMTWITMRSLIFLVSIGGCEVDCADGWQYFHLNSSIMLYYIKNSYSTFYMNTYCKHTVHYHWKVWGQYIFIIINYSARMH